MEAVFKKVLKGHSSAVYTLFFDEKYNRVYSGSADRMVGSWDMIRSEPDTFSVRLEQPVFSLDMMDGKMLIGQGAGGVHVLDMQTKKEIRHLKYHKRPVFGILPNPVKPFCYFLGGDGLLSIVDRNDFNLQWSLPIAEDKLRSALLNETANLLLIGASDGYLRLLETDYYNVLHEIRAHEGGVYDLAWLPDEKLVSVGRDGHIRIWGLRNQKLEELDAIAAHNYAIYSVHLSPSGEMMATASRDKTVKIWRLDSLRKPLRISRNRGVGHTHSVNVVRWINEELLLSAGDDRDLYLWSISNS